MGTGTKGARENRNKGEEERSTMSKNGGNPLRLKNRICGWAWYFHFFFLNHSTLTRPRNHFPPPRLTPLSLISTVQNLDSLSCPTTPSHFLLMGFSSSDFSRQTFLPVQAPISYSHFLLEFTVIYKRSWPIFPVKGQVVNTSGLAGQEEKARYTVR